MSIEVNGCNAALDIIVALGLVVLLDCVEVLLEVSLVVQGHDHPHVVAARHSLRELLESVDDGLRGGGVAVDLLATQEEEVEGTLVGCLVDLHYCISIKQMRKRFGLDQDAIYIC